MEGNKSLGVSSNVGMAFFSIFYLSTQQPPLVGSSSYWHSIPLSFSSTLTCPVLKLGCWILPSPFLNFYEFHFDNAKPLMDILTTSAFIDRSKIFQAWLKVDFVRSLCYSSTFNLKQGGDEIKINSLW